MTRPPRNRAAVLAATTALTAALLAGCGNGNDEAQDPDPVGSSTSATPTDVPPDTSTPSESASTTDQPADTVTVPVYFVGETPQGPKLYREFRKVQADNPLEEAAALVTAGDALDPDYRTLFTSNAITSIDFSDGAGAIAVQLADDSWGPRPAGMTKRDAKLALQQLVYTLQGVQQSRVPVLFQVDADPVTVFGIDTAGGIKAAAPLDVLALVNVTAPEEGATVSGTFKASGVASSFEATVPWEIRQGDSLGQVVKKGFSTAEGWMDKLYPWETEVDVSDLAPGTYSFVAMTDDPSGGEGGGPTEDSKTITVE
ncbi:Gmad2 immunoglobulin-like domain-containing protein [Nocardioides sp.]|uniref:Gmad2 immunoglobulin-like domain-containing protein n=1 Tax=Nocardioides sp. TaxID=35761 RepID=UPI0031FE51B2|nr:hypothetical protein [Nocardioides sp.]